MHAPERLFEILCHSVKRHIERRAPSDKYIVMSGAKPVCGREPHYFPQATAHPVTLDGVSHLLRRGKAKTCRSRVAAFACLQHKCGGRYLDPGRRGQKFRSLPQPLHASNSCGGLSRLRRTAACGHVRDVPTGPFVHPLLPCARGNRDGVCARACSVDRSASRFKSPLRWGKEDTILQNVFKPRSFGPAHDFARLIREGLGQVNATAKALAASSKTLTRR